METHKTTERVAEVSTRVSNGTQLWFILYPHACGWVKTHRLQS